MSWLIEKPVVTGIVLLRASEVELGCFQAVTFTDVDPPTVADVTDERLRGTHGNFRIDGKVPPEVRAAYQDSKPLLLRFESHGSTLTIDVIRDGDPFPFRPPDKKADGTAFPFIATGPA